MKKLLSSFLIIIIVSLSLIGCKDRSSEIASLNGELSASKQKIVELESKITVLEKDKKALESCITVLENEKKALEEIENLPASQNEDKLTAFINYVSKLNNFSELVNMYYPKLDGAPAEAYSYQLHTIYKANGIDKLINALVDKDKTTIEGVAALFSTEFLIEEDGISLDSIIKDLNKQKAKESNSKRKAVILKLIEKCNWAKTLV